MFTNENTQKAAQDVLDFIIENPELHRQQAYFGEVVKGEDDFENVDDATTWSCNTTMCVAGTVLMQKYGGKEAVRRFNESDIISIDEAGQTLGLDSLADQHHIFMEMNESRAIDKLMAIANGDIEKFYDL